MRSSTSKQKRVEPHKAVFTECTIDTDGPTRLTSDTSPSRFIRPRRRNWFKRLFVLLIGGFVFGVIGIIGLISWVGSDLPNLASLELYRPWRITRVMDVDQKVIMEIAEQRRRVVSYQSLPPHVVHAFVAAEDANFFHHKGLAYTGIIRAFWRNMWRAKGAPKQGGSTITQQVVKTFLLSFKQTYTRKIKEAILARRLEQNLRKWEILYLYLNQIDFGRGCYGIEEASRYYFGKTTRLLTISESAILAGIPKNPERYNPANSIKLTTKRRNYVLRRMLGSKYIDQKTYQRIKKTPIRPYKSQKGPKFQRDYYTEAVRKRALRILTRYVKHRRKLRSRQVALKIAKKMLYRGGLRIETGLTPQAQTLAILALRRGLKKIDQRHGFRGPIQHIAKNKWARFIKKLQRVKPNPNRLQKAIVTDWRKEGFSITTAAGKGLIPWSGLAWAMRRSRSKMQSKQRRIRMRNDLLQAGDVIHVKRQEYSAKANGTTLYALEQIPTVQGAVIAIDPRSHQVRALVGGWDSTTHPFNRALWSKRQPGSTFKPIIYTAALDAKLYTAASLIDDTYLEMKVNGKTWIPRNANRTYRNKAIRMREALAFSVNTVAVRILDRIGPYRAIAMARKLGIRSNLTLKPSLALGASAIRPIALTNAYATFAGRGLYDEPVMITRILSHNGETIYNRLPNPRRVLSTGVSHIITSMLQDVVQKGTAKRARTLKRPIAGKTGTSNRARNAWFIGYTPEMCLGVWVGYDDRTPLGRGESGARTALPIFIDWMKAYHTTHTTPPKPFSVPDDVVHTKIDPETGRLAPPQQADFLLEVFLNGTQPTQYAHNQGPIANPRDYYKMAQ